MISEGWELGGLDYLCCIILYMYGITIALYVVTVKLKCGYLMNRNTGGEPVCILSTIKAKMVGASCNAIDDIVSSCNLQEPMRAPCI